MKCHLCTERTTRDQERCPGGRPTKPEPSQILLHLQQLFARDHSFGISPVTSDCWKRWVNTGPNSVASSFRTLGWSSSGPKTFEAIEKFSYSVFRNNNISGTWVCSFLLNTSVNWPLNSSAFQCPTEQHPFHSSFPPCDPSPSPLHSKNSAAHWWNLSQWASSIIS